MSICVAVKEKLTKDSGVAGGEEYDHIVKKLLAKPKAKGKSHNVKSKAKLLYNKPFQKLKNVFQLNFRFTEFRSLDFLYRDLEWLLPAKCLNL